MTDFGCVFCDKCQWLKLVTYNYKLQVANYEFEFCLFFFCRRGHLPLAQTSVCAFTNNKRHK
jgi:hypothetical protein